MDIRIVGGDQNHPPIVAATVENLTRRNALMVSLVNASGDLASGGDGATVDGANSAIRATVKSYLNSNPVAVVLVNPSGDAYNANSVAVVVNKWNLTPTQDTVNVQTGQIGITGDVSTKPLAGQTWPVSVASTLNVNIVGGSASANPVGVSGDVSVTPKAGQVFPVAEQNKIGVQVVGGSIGAQISASGDLPVQQKGAWATAVTGDVSTIPKAGSTWPTAVQNVVGVQIVGGAVGGTVSPSGDIYVVQRGATATAVTGDVSTKPLAGQTWPVAEQNKIGVQVVGGTTGVSGDVSTIPKAGSTWPVSLATNVNTNEQNVIGVQIIGGSGGGTIGVSGDVRIRQGSPIAVSITGDATSPINVTFPTTNPLSVREQNVIGVQVVGGSGGGTVGVSGDVRIKQVGGIAVSITGDSATPINVQFPATSTLNVREQNVLGVQVVGGSGGGTIGVSGDVRIRQGSPIAVSITGDAASPINVTFPTTSPLSVREQNVIGVYIAGGSGQGTAGISGDVRVRQTGGFAVSITGDAATPINVQFPASSILNVRQQDVVGVYIAGGSGQGTAGISGDVRVKQTGGFAVAITGDAASPINVTTGARVVLSAEQNLVGVYIAGGSGQGTAGISGDVTTVPKAGQTWPTAVQNVVGVQIVGGSVGAQVSVGASGDLRIKQAGGLAVSITGDVLLRTNPGVNIGNVGTSGDATSAIRDGNNATIRATVKSYTNASPLTVVLVNATGDAYSPSTPTPAMETKSGVASWTGSYVLASVTAGKRLYVANYDFQSQADIGYAMYASGASGSQLTSQWILGAREGVAKHVSPNGNAYMFRTAPGVGLSLEHVGQNINFSVSYFTGDA